jgi:hypothetical protein
VHFLSFQDYNYNAPFFGAFGSNHAAQAASFWGPIIDWMPAARLKAQAQAGYAHVTCPADALYYACHLAPWGLMSLDPMTVRNGDFFLRSYNWGDEMGLCL